MGKIANSVPVKAKKKNQTIETMKRFSKKRLLWWH